MAGAGSRPQWTSSLRGATYECIARVHPHSRATRTDLLIQPNKVSILRPGQAQPKPTDVYELSYCYDATASNRDIFTRTVDPYVEKLLEGYNVNVILLGSTGSGKSLLLEGAPGAEPGDPYQNGLIQLVLAGIFKRLHEVSIKVGKTVAKQKRAVTTKSYAYFVELAFVESHEEVVYDLFEDSEGSTHGVPVIESAEHGWHLQGHSTRIAESAAEACRHFEAGRARHRTHETDVGNVQEHSLSVFSVVVYQYWPAMTFSEEDRVLRSEIRFAMCPGAERLAMDHALLRIREGPTLNQSLLSFSEALQSLQSRSAESFNTGQSVMTKLLSDSLGGNALTLMVGTLLQGATPESETVLKHLQIGSLVETYPAVNNNRIRGLICNIRARALLLQGQRQALQAQMEDLPADGAMMSVAARAKLSNVIEQNMQLKEESAVMAQERATLQERLRGYRETVEEVQREMGTVQEALIASEEKRLEVSRVLVDFKVEHNEALKEAEDERFALQQKILELEGRLAQGLVTAVEGAALEVERDQAQADLGHTHKQLNYTHKHIQHLMEQITELERSKHQLAQESQEETLQLRERLLSEKHSLHEKLTQEKKVAVEELENKVRLLESTVGQERQELVDRLALAEKRLAEQEPLVSKGQDAEGVVRSNQREVDELKSQIHELNEELSTIAQQRTYSDIQVAQLRDQYYKNVEQMAAQVSQLATGASASDVDSPEAAQRATDLQARFQQLQTQLVKTHAEREKDLLREIDELHARHLALRQNFKALSLGYRTLRYQVEDAQTKKNGLMPLAVVHEDKLLGAQPTQILQAEEDADRKLIADLRKANMRLGADMQRETVSRSATMNRQSFRARPAPAESSLDAYVEPPVQYQSGPAVAALQAEVESLKKENLELNTLLAAKSTDQQEYIVLLERKSKRGESRAIMAEEQLTALNKYMSKATQSYQSEIMRLRKALSQVQKGASRGVGPPGDAAPLPGQSQRIAARR